MENLDYAAFAIRIIRAHGRRIAQETSKPCPTSSTWPSSSPLIGEPRSYDSWLRVVLVVVAVAQRSCPVSSLLGDESLIAAVAGGVVGSVVLPAAPDHSEPGPGQDADGVGVAMAAGSGLLVEVGCPGVVVAGVTSEVHDRSAKLLVAGKAEHDLLVLA